MAGVLLNISGRANMIFCEYFVDDESEIQYLPTTTEKGTGSFKDNPSFCSCVSSWINRGACWSNWF